MANGFIVGEKAVKVTAALAHANCDFLFPASASRPATCTPPALAAAAQPVAGPTAPHATLPGPSASDSPLPLPRDGQVLQLSDLHNDESAEPPAASRKALTVKCKGTRSAAGSSHKRSSEPQQVCSDPNCTFFRGWRSGCAQ
jgi:hypothetical protein